MKKRIMIVDDASVARMKIRDILDSEDYEIVAECTNGQEAVDQYKILKPDLVTMDITMPEKDGIEALQEILLFNNKAKVLMITALDQREQLMKAIQMGAVDYIIKPYEDDRVTEAVQKALDFG